MVAQVNKWVFNRQKLYQFIRFCVVGVGNTAVYYVAYRLFLLVFPYLAAHVLGWCVATVFSFFMNAWFTFKVRPTIKRFLAFPLSSLVNLAVSTAASVLLVSGLNVSERWGTLVAGILAIPFTYLAMRFVFRAHSLESRKQ